MESELLALIWLKRERVFSCNPVVCGQQEREEVPCFEGGCCVPEAAAATLLPVTNILQPQILDII